MTNDLEVPQDDEDAYGRGYGPDGRWQLVPCIVCDADTQLRCSLCRHAVCHTCEACPNGCDAGTDYTTAPTKVGRE